MSYKDFDHATDVAERMLNEGRLSYVVIIKISKQNKAIFSVQVREKITVSGKIGDRHRSVQVVSIAKVFLCGVKNKQYDDEVSAI